jgi:signal transduction histidine kinase
MAHSGSGGGLSPLPSTRTQEVVASARWLLVMRWIAGVGALLATWFACSVLELGLASIPLYLTGVAILLYNALLWIMLGRLQADPNGALANYQRLAHLQVGLDWLAMTALIHFSGGVESPIIFFFIFHIIIASLLFSRRTAAVYTVTALLMVGGMVVLELAGWLPHVHVEGFLAGDSYQNPAFLIGVLGAFAATSVVTVYLASSIAERLRRREDQLGTLYLGAQTVSSTLDLPEVLRRLVQATARAMDVSAASIGLLDHTGTQVEVAAAYGLSDAYLHKGPILLQDNPIHAEVLSSGTPAIIQGEADQAKLQYPDAMEAENIRSILYVRLQARNRTLGVVRAYSRRSNRFTADDARFLSAIAAQGAVAIDNAMAYQALMKLDLDKSQFIRAVTHELRSPVTGAQSLLRGVIKGYAGGLTDRQRDIMGRLNRRLDKLEALINDLLDLAAGRSDLKIEERKPLPLVRTLEHVVAYLESSAREKDQELVFEHPPGDPIVSATEEGLDRIFVNLVGNAVKYTPEGGTVRVSVREHDHQVTVEVKDTGIGIPADSLPRLFSEFYRAPNAKAFETGTGLGLVIVKELVESFSGRISVESEEGRGTAFTVHLPLVAG